MKAPNRIRELRKNLNISQQQLAKAVHIKRTYLSNLENGKYRPNVFLANELAKALGTSTEELFL